MVNVSMLSWSVLTGLERPLFHSSVVFVIDHERVIVSVCSVVYCLFLFYSLPHDDQRERERKKRKEAKMSNWISNDRKSSTLSDWKPKKQWLWTMIKSSAIFSIWMRWVKLDVCFKSVAKWIFLSRSNIELVQRLVTLIQSYHQQRLKLLLP